MTFQSSKSNIQVSEETVSRKTNMVAGNIPVFDFDGKMIDSGVDISSAGSGFPLSSQNYEVVVADGTPAENGTKLLADLEICKTKNPNGSASDVPNRAVLYLLEGVYDLGENSISINEFDSSFIDIIGIGSSEGIIITSNSNSGTINIGSVQATYSLKNFTVINTAMGGSIASAFQGEDHGLWDNLIIKTHTSTFVNYYGTYTNLKCTADRIMLGNIFGHVRNCFFNSRSCGYSETNDIEIGLYARIDNCHGGNNCFGASGTGNVEVYGTIVNTTVTYQSIAFSGAGNVTLSGKIENCHGQNECFGASTLGNVTLAGKINNCKTDNNGFGFSSSKTIIEGAISNCHSGGYAFGFGKSVTFNGIIDSCVANGGFGFSGEGDSEIDAVIFETNSLITNCIATSSPAFGFGQVPIHLAGVMKNCILNSVGFGFSYAPNSPVQISGGLYNCSAKGGMAFGVSSNSYVEISTSAIIKDCSAWGYGFGVAQDILKTCFILGNIDGCIGYDGHFFGDAHIGEIGGTISNCEVIGWGTGFGKGLLANSGTIKNCTVPFSTEASFGPTTATGKLINCTSGGYVSGTQLGTIDGLKINKESGGESLLILGEGAVLKNSELIKILDTTTDTVTIESGSTVSIYKCAFDKAPNAISAIPYTNNINTPYNIIDENLIS